MIFNRAIEQTSANDNSDEMKCETEEMIMNDHTTAEGVSAYTSEASQNEIEEVGTVSEMAENNIKETKVKERHYRPISTMRVAKRNEAMSVQHDVEMLQSTDNENHDYSMSEEYDMIFNRKMLDARRPAPEKIVNMHNIGNYKIIKEKAVFKVSEPTDTDIVSDPQLDLSDDLFSEVARRINNKLRSKQRLVD